MNTRVRVLIQRRSQRALRLRSPRPGDRDVKALRITLRTVQTTSSMQSNNLVAQDVVARGDTSWDRRSPRIILRNQLRARPLLRSSIDTSSLDLDPLQLRLIRLGAVAVAGGDVVNDRAVGVRPRASSRRAPLERDLSASLHRRRERARRRVLVAVDVGGLVRVGRHEPAVEVLRVPRRERRYLHPVLLVVVVLQQEPGLLYPVRHVPGHITVS